MAGDGQRWEAEKMFELYLYDYMMRKNMHNTAEIFKQEANVPDHSVAQFTSAIDAPDGFLHEWWSIFSDIYLNSQNNNNSNENKAETSLQATQRKEETVQPQSNHSAEPHEEQEHQVPVQFRRSKSKFDDILERPAPISAEIEPSPSSFGLNKPKLSHSVAMSSSSASPQMLEEMKQGNRFSLGRSGTLENMISAFRSSLLPTLGSHDSGTSNAANNPMPLKKDWPVSAPSNQQQSPILPAELQQPHFPILMSSKILKQTSGSGNSSEIFSSDPILNRKETKGNKDKVMNSSKKTAEQQNQPDQPPKQPRKPRRKKAPSNSRAGKNPVTVTKADSNSVVENVNSAFSQASNNVVNTSSSVQKGHSSGIAENKNQGFHLQEVNCFHSSKHALSSCQFSPDGKLLACGGSEGKVFVWHVEACYSATTTKQHSLPITDVQFRPNSSIFVTSSLDKTMKIWDAAKPNRTFCDLYGHSGEVMSLDFNPRNTDLLCSCDSNDEIRLWSFANSTTIITSKGATKQVRFQPGHEKLLATASRNVVNLFDVETSKLLLSFEGHTKDVVSICWDYSGEYLLSVSEESARIWSMMSYGKCIYELRANDKRFQSCTFHPGHQNIGIIGGHKSLELWSPINSVGTLSIPAHEGSVTALAQVRKTLMVASSSDDCCVKLWK